MSDTEPAYGAWGDALVAAVRSGDVAEAAIDRKVVRILRLAERVGALDDTVPTAVSGSDADSLDVAREAAVRGTVLLRNDGVLPLHEPARIAVIGEGARWARTQGGGSATVIPASISTPLDAIRDMWPGAEVSWSLGAVVQSGIADLAPGTFTFDGRDGMRVRYLDAAGTELASEIRTASGIVSFDAAALASRSALVEFTFRFSPDEPVASAPFAVAGVSDWEVEVHGEQVASGALRTQPGDDPATAILTPPWAAVTLPIGTGSADITVRFRPAPSAIAGALALRVGTPPLEADAAELAREAAEAAANADVAIVIVSTSAEVESEGFDRSTLALPGAQDALVRSVIAANPRTIVVVNSGAPVLLPWRDEAAAVLAVWFPGQEFGSALAAVLAGDAEPAGRLPVTWPGQETDVPVTDVTPVDGVLPYREGLHIGYRAWRRADATPAYPFGWGLGYTSWSIDGVALDSDDEGMTAITTIANTGARTGTTVVQLYASRPDSAIERPATWLVGFATVTVEPGETETTSVRVPWRRLSHWADGWQLEAGGFELRAALHVDDPGLTARVEARAIHR